MDDIHSSITGTVIRAAGPQDVATIDGLLRNLAEAVEDSEGYSGNVGTLRGQRFRETQPVSSATRGTGGGRCCLCVCFPGFSTWRGQPGVYVQGLFVMGSLRGTGIGARLITAAIRDAAEEWGARYSRPAVQSVNRGALGFYTQSVSRRTSTTRSCH